MNYAAQQIVSHLDESHSKYIIAVNLTTAFLLLMVNKSKEAIDFIKHANQLVLQ